MTNNYSSLLVARASQYHFFYRVAPFGTQGHKYTLHFNNALYNVHINFTDSVVCLSGILFYWGDLRAICFPYFQSKLFAQYTEA